MRCCDCWRWPAPHWEVTVIGERSAKGDDEHPAGEAMEPEVPVLLGSVATIPLQETLLLGVGVATSHFQGWK